MLASQEGRGKRVEALTWHRARIAGEALGKATLCHRRASGSPSVGQFEAESGKVAIIRREVGFVQIFIAAFWFCSDFYCSFYGKVIAKYSSV